MELKLPNGEEVKLDENITITEKLNIVEVLVCEWETYCIENWNNYNVKFFLDGLSNYLVWHKEDREKDKRGKEDKFILSKKKVEKLTKFKKDSKYVNFSDLNNNEKGMLLGDKYE